MKQKIGGYILICLGLFVLIGGMYYYYPRIKDYKESQDLYNDIRGKYVQEPSGTTENLPTDVSENDIYPIQLGINTEKFACIEVDGISLLEENEDYVGWIYIPGTDISYPVVRGEDHNEYLHTNFQGEYSYSGCIFLDYRCTEEILNKHMILYGHNMRDGSMFAGIKKYSEKEFFEKHPVFWFITPEAKYQYEIFSVCTPNPYDSVFYSVDGVEYLTEEEYLEDMNLIAEASVHEYDIQLDKSDYVMTLSTCTGNSGSRFTIHGVLQKIL